MQVTIDIFLTLVENGYTYADLRDECINVCLLAEEEAGYTEGAEMCPGISDRYYPHVSIKKRCFLSDIF